MTTEALWFLLGASIGAFGTAVFLARAERQRRSDEPCLGSLAVDPWPTGRPRDWPTSRDDEQDDGWVRGACGLGPLAHPMGSRLLALLSRHGGLLGNEGFEIYNALATGEVEIVAGPMTPPRTVDKSEGDMNNEFPRLDIKDEYYGHPFDHKGCPDSEFGTSWMGDSGRFCPGCGQPAPEAARDDCGACLGENCAECTAPPGVCACSDRWPDWESHPLRPRGTGGRS